MLGNKILPDESNAGQQNCRHIGAGGRYQMMAPCDGSGSAPVRSHNDLPPPLRGDAPMMVGPHDGGRLRNDNASAPTRVATHINNASPGYKGVSPAVARELYKAPPAFGQRIRDHARNK